MPFVFDKNLQDTSIIYLYQTRLRSQIIYSTTLLSIVIILLSLPYIYTTVSVRGTGLMQSNIEKVELLAPANGRLLTVSLIDNQKVKKDADLLTIDATLPNQQKNLIGNHRYQLHQQLSDVQKVIIMLDTKPRTYAVKLNTQLYAASLQQYTEALQNVSNAKDQTNRILNRYKILLDKKVVTTSEYEQYQYNYSQALSDYEMVIKKYRLQWQTEANQYRNQLRDLQNQSVQINDLVKQYTLKAPIGGSIQNLTGLQKGSYVYANQKLGEISPDSLLLAYCYIRPTDIGLIRRGQDVRFQIDAFNYNQWGLLTGVVLDISDDVILQNNTPYFRVKCKLNKDFLRLKSGYKGQIKKGMTFTARFSITKRSLYQLLYDNMDDWLNPNGSEGGANES